MIQWQNMALKPRTSSINNKPRENFFTWWAFLVSPSDYIIVKLWIILPKTDRREDKQTKKVYFMICFFISFLASSLVPRQIKMLSRLFLSVPHRVHFLFFLLLFLIVLGIIKLVQIDTQLQNILPFFFSTFICFWHHFPVSVSQLCLYLSIGVGLFIFHLTCTLDYSYWQYICLPLYCSWQGKLIAKENSVVSIFPSEVVARFLSRKKLWW